MPDTKGWTKSSNRLYLDELKAKRNGHRPKNSGAKCDYCTLDNHERCYRVGCYCKCASEKNWGDAWPARKVEL